MLKVSSDGTQRSNVTSAWHTHTMCFYNFFRAFYYTYIGTNANLCFGCGECGEIAQWFEWSELPLSKPGDMGSNPAWGVPREVRFSATQHAHPTVITWVPRRKTPNNKPGPAESPRRPWHVLLWCTCPDSGHIYALRFEACATCPLVCGSSQLETSQATERIKKFLKMSFMTHRLPMWALHLSPDIPALRKQTDIVDTRTPNTSIACWRLSFCMMPGDLFA